MASHIEQHHTGVSLDTVFEKSFTVSAEEYKWMHITLKSPEEPSSGTQKGGQSGASGKENDGTESTSVKAVKRKHDMTGTEGVKGKKVCK